jgi:uncharacterized protein
MPGQRFRPTTSGERLEILDALRGFALFGILLANLTSFFGYSSLSPSEFADIRTLTAAEPRWSKAVDLYLRGVVVIGIDREI